MTTEKSILIFGDSNTHGTIPLRAPGDLDRYPRAQRWPNILAAELGPGHHVIAEGHPGRTTVHDDPLGGGDRSGLKVLNAILASHRPLDLVVVMLGTNDLKARFAATPADIATGVDQLLQAIAASDAGPSGAAPRALLAVPVPIIETGFLAEMFFGGAEKSDVLAVRLAAVAARHGAGYFDAGAVGAVDPDEGIHLTVAAHQAIGAAIAGPVRAILHDDAK